MPVRSVPGSASVANPDGGKLFAPSAARNLNVLCDLLVQVAKDTPKGGHALELASGTGQHVVGYGACLPDLIWQPSEADPNRVLSIDTHVADAALSNVLSAKILDATAAGWAKTTAPVDLLVVSNLLHLISTPEARTLIQEAGQSVKIGGIMVIYGPFSRGGELTSTGDQDFHTSLQAHDPETGYKDDFDLLDWALEADFTPREVVEMPANNLAFVLEKS